MSEQLYKVFIPSVKGLRKLVPYNADFYSNIFKDYAINKSEGYESIYLYEQKHFDKLKTSKSLAGIKDVKTDKVVFDFDSKDDVENALKDTRVLINRLLATGFSENELGCHYSGNKGFHVEVSLNELLTREQFEAITESYAGDLQTFDTSVSDEQRVFRLPLSFNPKSNKYKIPLTVDELLDPETKVSGIAEYAQSPDFKERTQLLL